MPQPVWWRSLFGSGTGGLECARALLQVLLRRVQRLVGGPAGGREHRRGALHHGIDVLAHETLLELDVGAGVRQLEQLLRGADVGADDAFDEARAHTGEPTVIICDTRIGSGVPLLETREKAHFMRVGAEEWQTTRDQLAQGFTAAGSATDTEGSDR